MNLHLFRKHGTNHGVLNTRTRVRRNGRSLTLCAMRVDGTFQRLAPFPPGDRRQHNITCSRCDRAFDGFVDALDTDFGFRDQADDGTGRFGKEKK